MMTPEDKKRIEQEAFEHAQKSWQLTHGGEGPFQKGYIAGAEAEFNRREKMINEFEKIIADGCSNCREFREEFAMTLRKYKGL